MRYVLASFAISLAPALAGGAFAQTAKQIESNGRASAKAEQSLVMASCKLDWLRGHAGVSRSSPEFFTFMASCLTRQATR
jgi:hypothetical protein